MSKTPISWRIEPAILKELKKLAEKENRTLNNYVETILLEHIKKQKKWPFYLPYRQRSLKGWYKVPWK